VLWPKGFSLSGYELVFKNRNILRGFLNSIVYTLSGTLLAVVLTTLTAYPLAHPNFKRFSKIYMKFVVFTMLFGGGLIPAYLVICSLHMINTLWVIIVPGSISAF
jgi:putative aldouronate transport system permease protein